MSNNNLPLSAITDMDMEIQDGKKQLIAVSPKKKHTRFYIQIENGIAVFYDKLHRKIDVSELVGLELTVTKENFE